MKKHDNIKSKTDQRPFIMVYQDFLESDVLDNHYQKLIYIYLKKFADSNNQCFPSLKTIAELTKISVSKVKTTLKELEEKEVLRKENRTRSDGGCSSNLYVLYDYKETWENVNSVEPEDDNDDQELIKYLISKGYKVTKEKNPDVTTPHQENTTPHRDTQETRVKRCQHHDTSNQNKSQEEEQFSPKKIQEERYSIEYLYQLYDYDKIYQTEDYSQYRLVPYILNILHTTLNTTKPTIRIKGESLPSGVVISKLLKLDSDDILYAAQKFDEQTERIGNPISYMLTILYQAKEQSCLDYSNMAMYDMTHPTQEFDQKTEECEENANELEQSTYDYNIDLIESVMLMNSERKAALYEPDISEVEQNSDSADGLVYDYNSSEQSMEESLTAIQQAVLEKFGKKEGSDVQEMSKKQAESLIKVDGV